jgi:hypothetical protein
MAFTVEVTSMPLPEVLVAEFRMAFTASWIAAEVLELVALDVLDSPRSSASDSLDRSELIPVVLIPHLLGASAARGPGSGAPDSYLIGNFVIPLRVMGNSP